MEQKYESDMTKKEKRDLELQKIKGMPLSKKLEHLWIYYKAWILVLIAIIMGIALIISIIQGTQKNVVANIVIVGGYLDDDETAVIQNEVKTRMGATGKQDTVIVKSNLSADDEDGNTEMALTTYTAADSVDVLVCTEKLYQKYRELDGFEGDVLLFQNTEALQEILGVTYENIYVGVIVNPEHPQGAEAFKEYLIENAGQEPKLIPAD